METQLAGRVARQRRSARAAGERSEADELRALRREVTLLRQENDILKKAAVILGTRLPTNSAK